MMTKVSNSGRQASTDGDDRPTLWEERSASRVLDTSRDQILERSRKIVEAAYELLEEEGLEGLTIRAVLNRTKLSRRAFYERFEGKDDLVLAVFEQTIRMATSFYSKQTGRLSDPLERLELIVNSIVLGSSTLTAPPHGEGDRRGAAQSREHLRLAESRPHDLQAALSPLIALLAQQLSAGMESGAVRRADPQQLATFLYNLVSTTVHTELLTRENAEPNPAHRAQLASNIWEFCRRAIAA
jgi:AcrR family transcriptional regulator